LRHFLKGRTDCSKKKLNKALSEDGELLVTTPNYQSAWSVIEKTIDLFELSPKLWGEQHLIKFTPKRLKNVFEDCGFKVKKMGTLNHISPVIAFVSPEIADKIITRRI